MIFSQEIVFSVNPYSFQLWHTALQYIRNVYISFQTFMVIRLHIHV